MFTIIVIVAAIWICISFGGRISRLEKDVKELKGSGAPQPFSATPSPMSAAAPASVSASVQTQTSTQTSAPAPTPTRAPLGEEASGRFLGKIGIAAVLIGVAFFLKYAFDSNWIGPAGRVMIGVIAGLGFLGVGQYLRGKYLKYSDLLMGGGIAILYLSVFSANSFYHLIDPFTTGVFMFIVTLLSFAISIVNATQTLAVVGILGGFATPYLVGSHENAMIQLFGYLTLLNLGVLAVSFFKKWPKLNAIALVGTGINFFGWYATFYTSDVLPPTILFVFVSFIIFLVASVARVIVSGTKADQVDYFLLGINAFATATIGFMILQPQYHSVLGFASVLLAIIYCVVAFIANKFNPEDKALNIFLPGLAVVFLSIAVPMQFSGPWIAVAWFIESVVLYVIASFISNRGFQVMGIVVYILGCFDFIVWSGRQYATETFTPIMNTSFVILILATIAAYAIAYMYQRFGSITVEIQKRGIMVFVIVANVITIFALSSQIINYHQAAQISLSKTYQEQMKQSGMYNSGYDTSGARAESEQAYYTESSRLRNQSNTLVSVLWALYAAILTAIGFARRIASVRRLGLALFVFTAVKVVVDVWSLGQLYRIISFIVFGIIALVASFAYAKYKDRLKDIV